MSLTTFYALIPHPFEVMVYLIAEGNQWRLPAVQGEEHYSNSAEFLRRRFKEQLGLDLIVLRWADYHYDAQSDSLSFFYAFENHSTSRSSAHGRWFDREELPSISMSDSDHLSVIQKWLDEIAGGPIHPLRSPWANPGWFGQASGWVANCLASVGQQISGDIEQIKIWQRSCVLRIPTLEGAVYFKAVPKGFRMEALVSEFMFQRFPQHSPDFIAFDTSRCWMLAKDIGGVPLAKIPDVQVWKAAIKAYARMQIESTSIIDELVEFGCPSHPVVSFPEMIDDLIIRGHSFQPEIPGALNADEREKFFRVLPAIKRDCVGLASFSIPSSLEHGDLNPWNILIAPGRDAHQIAFIDWSDSLITHPFLSLAPLFGLLDSVFADPNSVQEILVHAYLEEWRNFAAPELLFEAYKISSRLAWLNAALIMHRQVLPILEIPSEFIGTEGLFLRFMLDRY